jgi:predicted permease
MLVAPVVAAGIALVLPFSNPVVARVFVLECAMPAAVTPLILVGEFSEGDIEGVTPESYVSTVVFTSTLVSIPVLTVLIGILRSGAVI